MTKRVFLVLACLGLQAAAWAQDQARERKVEFAKGKSGAVLTDAIKGYDSVNYKLGASAGQQMEVTLKSSNRSNYFNILAPGDDAAMFIGSTSGDHFAGVLPKTGDYTVQVYLMRNAARRNEIAKYTIDFKIKAGAKASK